MARSTSLEGTTTPAINRQIDSRYDKVAIVADNLSDVVSIANSVPNINTVAGIHTEIASLAADKVTLDSLYADKVTLDSLYKDKVTLDSLYTDKTTLDSLYNDRAALDALYTRKAEIDSLFADKATLDSLFADKITLDGLYSDKTALDSLYADKTKLDSLYADKTTIDGVYAKLAELSVIATDVDKGKGTNTSTDSAILNALTNANIAITQADIAITKATEAAASEVNALASENASKTSEVASANSKTAANAQAVIATNKAIESANSATAASTSEINAAGSATNASNSATVSTNQAKIATTQANNASASAVNAATSETTAYNWAMYPDNTLVPEGNGTDEYSAKHWADKAANVATGTLKYLGKWDATTLFPSSPHLGDYYKVSVAGPESSAPFTYNVNDSIIYNGSSWDKLGNTDAVSSIDGKIGAVTLDSVYEAKNANIQAHIADTNNPHIVTKVQVGLGNVDNTSDVNKPVSTAQQAALDGKVDNNQVLTNVPSGAVFTDTVYNDTNIQAAVSLNTAKVGITTAQANDIVANNAKVSDINHNVTTNLSTTTTTTTATVVSSDGTNAVIPAVTTAKAGVMTSADKAKLNGIESGATADQTAAEILTAIKTVDGAGSGIDADLLDGHDSSYFAPQASTYTKAEVDSKTGSTGFNYKLITANTTAINMDYLQADTSAGVITITLPATPLENDVIGFLDVKGTFDTNSLTVARNGKLIMGLAQDMVVSTKNMSFELIYINGDWRIKQ